MVTRTDQFATFRANATRRLRERSDTIVMLLLNLRASIFFVPRGVQKSKQTYLV
jgi:hypothetical protein